MVKVKFYNLLSYDAQLGILYAMKLDDKLENIYPICNLDCLELNILAESILKNSIFILTRDQYILAKEIIENPMISIMYFKKYKNRGYWFSYFIDLVMYNQNIKYEIVSDCEYTMKQENNNFYII